MIYGGISATQIFCSKIVILLVSHLKASPSCFTVSSSSRLTFIERRWSSSYSSSTSYLFQGFCHSVVKIKRSNLCLKKCLFKDVFHLWDNVFCQIIFPCKITVVASYVPVFLILLQSYITTSLHQLFFKNLRNIFQLLCYFSSSIFQKFEIPSRYITTSLHCYINFPKICGLVL